MFLSRNDSGCAEHPIRQMEPSPYKAVCTLTINGKQGKGDYSSDTLFGAYLHRFTSELGEDAHCCSGLQHLSLGSSESANITPSHPATKFSFPNLKSLSFCDTFDAVRMLPNLDGDASEPHSYRYPNLSHFALIPPNKGQRKYFFPLSALKHFPTQNLRSFKLLRVYTKVTDGYLCFGSPLEEAEIDMRGTPLTEESLLMMFPLGKGIQTGPHSLDFPSLTRLVLHNLDGALDTFLSSMDLWCPNLVELRLLATTEGKLRFSNEAIEGLARHLRQRRTLEIFELNCAVITDEQLSALGGGDDYQLFASSSRADGLKAKGTIRQLVWIGVVGYTSFGFTHFITASHVLNHNIEALSFTESSAFDDDCLSALLSRVAALSPSSSARCSIQLYSNPRLTGSGFTQCKSNEDKLDTVTVLDLYNCSAINDSSLNYLHSFRGLQQLCLYGTAVSEAGYLNLRTVYESRGRELVIF